MELDIKELKRIDGEIVQLIPVAISELKELLSRELNHIKYTNQKIEDLEGEVIFHQHKVELINKLLKKEEE